MSYRWVDTLGSDQLEPGDLIKNNDGEVVQVFKVKDNYDGTTTVTYLDDYLDEELDFLVTDESKIDLFVFDDDD